MEMKYSSTRGGASGFSFQEALLSGFAPDGGLFVPDSLPRFSLEDLKSWANLTYPQLIENFARLFISQDEIANQEIPGKFSVLCSSCVLSSYLLIASQHFLGGADHQTMTEQYT